MCRNVKPGRLAIASRARGPHCFHHHRGQALVYLILILFAVMSLAALLIDLGFARLAQRQMQSAVDSAAVEGLRFRDEIPMSLINTYATELEEACGPIDSSDPTWRDCARRWLAAKRVGDMFDDDLDPTNGDAANLSAGPVVTFGAEQVPVTAASQTMDTGVYDPMLQPNLGDNGSGDMVAGTFEGAAASHQEANDYSRSDFSPGIGDKAFLVRMRRTDEDFSLLTGSHSGGPTVPVVFGRGSVIDRDLLARGIVARATAIADARHVLSVCAPITGSVGGYSHLAVALNPWATLPIGVPKPSQVTIAGQIHTLARTTIASGGTGAQISVTSQFGFPDPSVTGAQYELQFPSLNETRLLVDIDDTDATNWTTDSPITLMGGEPVLAREADTGIHVEYQLLQNINAAETTIRVNSADDVLDPNNVPSAAFTIQIDDELLRLVDLDDTDATLWTVERGINSTISSGHSFGAAVHVRDARILADPVTASASTIAVKSLVRNVDPDNHAEAKYLVVIGGEWMVVDDISLDTDGFPTIWSVSRVLPEPHSAGEPVRPPFQDFATVGIGFARRYESGIVNGANKLAADVSDSQTNLTVSGEWNTPDPNSDPVLAFTIRIDNEWIRVVDRDDTNELLWTVERGVGNTTSQPHSANADVLNASPILFGDVLISADGTEVPSSTAPIFSAVCPIYNQLANDRIVGFGLGTKAFDSTWDLPSEGYVGLSLQKADSRVVSENVSGLFVRHFARDIPSSNVSQRIVIFESLTRVLNVSKDVVEPAFAAVSVR